MLNGFSDSILWTNYLSFYYVKVMGQSVEMMMVMFGSLEGRVEWIL